MMFQLFQPKASALFSPCGTWRYTLSRRFAPGPTIAFVGLNPSSATQYKLDNTTKKCLRWARREGYGQYVMLNLFGLVSTDPDGLLTAEDPNGPGNDAALMETFATATAIVFCWGVTLHKFTAPRIKAVEQMAEDAGVEPLCPGYTKAGFPRHPLYVKNNTQLIPYKRPR